MISTWGLLSASNQILKSGPLRELSKWAADLPP